MNEFVKTERGRIILAMATVYLVWGSTFLGIRYAIESLPPFLMAGIRFVAAGSLLFLFARLKTRESLKWVHWRSALITGGLMFLGGNGMVVWSEQRIPSGMASMLVATVPLWIVILSWKRPDPRIFAGLILGFLGILLLVGPARIAGGGRIDPLGAFAVVMGSSGWAAGSLYTRKAPLPRNQFLSASMQMLMGGLVLLTTGTLAGEWVRFHPRSISVVSGLSLLYLIFFGSIIAFTAYAWLLGRVSPSKVATYAYVNPVVAVILGSLIAHEPFSLRTLIASLVILSAVVVVTTRRAEPPKPALVPHFQPGETTQSIGTAISGGRS